MTAPESEEQVFALERAKSANRIVVLAEEVADSHQRAVKRSSTKPA